MSEPSTQMATRSAGGSAATPDPLVLVVVSG